MNNRWTIEELKRTDDLMFAMCILSERREKLNQEAPLAKKIAKAYHTLSAIRSNPVVLCCDFDRESAKCKCEPSPFYGLLVENDDYCPYGTEKEN